MGAVIAKQGATADYKPSLQDFMNMFNMKGTEFKTPVSSTKGVLYIKNGRLCNANVHGGKSSVTSSVTNLALRNALYTAFEDAGATQAFLAKVEASLLGDAKKSQDLKRSEVKDLIVQFKTDALETQKALSRQAYGAMIGTEDQLNIDDFRKLANGSGYVGEALEGESSGWVVLEHDTGNEGYNAKLRCQLYNALLNALLSEEVAPQQRENRVRFLQDLQLTLIGSDLNKPLSCDKIRETLASLDSIVGSVQPKALGDRKIALLVPAPENAEIKPETAAWAKRKARDLMAKESAKLLGLLADFPGMERFSEESQMILLNVMMRTAESLYAARRGTNAGVELDELTAPDSNFALLKELAEAGQFSVSLALSALSLPPKESSAFLWACRLVPVGGPYGMDVRLFSVASQLAKLPSDKFTAENIMRLAVPDLAFPPELRGTDLVKSVEAQTKLFAPFQRLVDESCEHAQPAAANKDMVAVYQMIPFMFRAGMSLRDVRAVQNNPESFSLSMLEDSAFLPKVLDPATKNSDAVGLLFADVVARNRHQITIVDQDGRATSPLPPEVYESERDERLKTQDQINYQKAIADLCGERNVEQQQLVTLFMTQNTEDVDSIVKACLERKSGPSNTQYVLKSDPATGDVYVSKTSDPNLDYGFSVTVRIGTDASMSVVDRQERKEAGRLVPKDWKGDPMIEPDPREEDVRDLASGKLKPESLNPNERVSLNQKIREWFAGKLAVAGQKNPKASCVLKEWGAKLTSAAERSHDLDSEVCRQLLVLVDAGYVLNSPKAKTAFAKLADHFLTLPLSGSMKSDEAWGKLMHIQDLVESQQNGSNPEGRVQTPAEMRYFIRDVIASLSFKNGELEVKRDALVKNLAAGYDVELQNMPVTSVELERTLKAVKALEDAGEPFVEAALSGVSGHVAEVQALKRLGDLVRTQQKACADLVWLQARHDVFNTATWMALERLEGALGRISQKVDAHLAKDPANINVSLLFNWARRELAAVEGKNAGTLSDLRKLAAALDPKAKNADGQATVALAKKVLKDGQNPKELWSDLRKLLPTAVGEVISLLTTQRESAVEAKKGDLWRQVDRKLLMDETNVAAVLKGEIDGLLMAPKNDKPLSAKYVARNKALANDVVALFKRLAESKPEGGRVACSFGGMSVNLKWSGAGNPVTATVYGAKGNVETVDLGTDAAGMLARLADEIGARPDVFGDSYGELLEVFSSEHADRGSLASLTERNLCERIIQNLAGVPADRLANVSTAGLLAIAKDVMNQLGKIREIERTNKDVGGMFAEAGRQIVEGWIAVLAEEKDRTRVSSADAQALVDAMRADPKASEKVVVPKNFNLKQKIGGKLSDEQREKAAHQQALRDLAADLVLPEDASLHDSATSSGDELRTVLVRHADTLAKLMIAYHANPGTAFEGMSDEAKTILETLLNNLQVAEEKKPDAEENKKETNGLFGFLNSMKSGFQNLGKVVKDLEKKKFTFKDVFQKDLDQGNERALATKLQAEFQSVSTVNAAMLQAFALAIGNEIRDTMTDEQGQLVSLIETAFSSDEVKPVTACKNIGDMFENAQKPGDSGYIVFVKELLQTYFTNVDPIDQKAMAAALLRYAPEDPPDGAEDDPERTAQTMAKLAAMLKGAGPLLQKILQGLDAGLLGENALALAIKDMKKNLAPIPEEVVKAHLYDVVVRSGGKLTKIEAEATLGCATVGQAIRCRAYGPGLPKDGKEIVVKILRPDALRRIEREKNVVLPVAEKNAIKDSYSSQLASILEEFDFKHEASNIEAGKVYENRKDRVGSVKVDNLVQASTATLVMECAPGKTAADVIDDEAKGLDDPKTSEQIEKEYKDLSRLQKDLCEMAKVWVTEGLYGSGFFHGDLHSGNIMLDPEKGVTMIDYGNVTRLSKEEKENVTLMMAAATLNARRKDASDGYDKAVGTCVGYFMEGLENLLSVKAKDKLKQNETVVREMLTTVLAAGSEADAGKRIYIALTELQRLGIEIPGPIFKFSQSQIRLQNTIDAVNRVLLNLKEKFIDLTFGVPSYYSIWYAIPKFQSILTNIKTDWDNVYKQTKCKKFDKNFNKNRAAKIKDFDLDKTDLNSADIEEFVTKIKDDLNRILKNEADYKLYGEDPDLMGSNRQNDTTIESLVRSLKDDDVTALWNKVLDDRREEVRLEEVLNGRREEVLDDSREEVLDDSREEVLDDSREEVLDDSREKEDGLKAKFDELAKEIIACVNDHIEHAITAEMTAEMAKFLRTPMEDFFDCMGQVIKANVKRTLSCLPTKLMSVLSHY